MKLHHVAVQVRDLERARAFYADVLGLKETRRQAHSIWLDADGVVVMLELCSGDVADDAWKSDRPGLHLLALSMAASERATWISKLEGAGHAIEAETDYTIYMRDPDGTRIGLSSYPEKSR